MQLHSYMREYAFSTFSRKCQVFKNLSGQKIFSYNIDYMNILKQLYVYDQVITLCGV